MPRSIFSFARDDTDKSESRIMTQVKNSLGRDDLPSMSYQLNQFVVPTPKGDAETSHFVFVGESERSVHDVLRDSRAVDADTKGERDEAGEWLRGFLQHHGGSAKAADVLAAGRADGIAEATLKRARKRADVESERVGFGKGTVWSLGPAAHSDHSDHHRGRDPNDPNAGRASAEAHRACQAWDESSPDWTLKDRDGRCIACEGERCPERPRSAAALSAESESAQQVRDQDT